MQNKNTYIDNSCIVLHVIFTEATGISYISSKKFTTNQVKIIIILCPRHFVLSTYLKGNCFITNTKKLEFIL